MDIQFFAVALHLAAGPFGGLFALTPPSKFASAHRTFDHPSAGWRRFHRFAQFCVFDFLSFLFSPLIYQWLPRPDLETHPALAAAYFLLYPVPPAILLTMAHMRIARWFARSPLYRG